MPIKLPSKFAPYALSLLVFNIKDDVSCPKGMKTNTLNKKIEIVKK